jgi:hypothetical protein
MKSKTKKWIGIFLLAWPFLGLVTIALLANPVLVGLSIFLVASTVIGCVLWINNEGGDS